MHHKPAQGAAAETSVHTSRVCLASRTVEQPQACSISQSFMATRVANPNCRWLVHAAVASTLYTSAAGQATAVPRPSALQTSNIDSTDVARM